MKIYYYFAGLLVGLLRTLFSIFLTFLEIFMIIFEAPIAAHILGKHCAKLKKYPKDFTEEELMAAMIEHHGEDFLEDYKDEE